MSNNLDQTPSIDEDFATWNERMVRRFDPDLYHSHSSPFVIAIKNRRVRAIRQLLELKRHHRLVDVGCGGGNILDVLNAKHKTGVDLSEFLLDKARVRLGEGTELIRASADALPFRDAHFDRLVCSEVLEHVNDPLAVVRELRRVLAHNGVAVITIPNEAQINRAKQLLMRARIFRLLLRSRKGGYVVPEKMEDEWHLHAFSDGLLREVTEGLFRIKKLVKIPFPYLPLGFAAQLEPIG